MPANLLYITTILVILSIIIALWISASYSKNITHNIHSIMDIFQATQNGNAVAGKDFRAHRLHKLDVIGIQDGDFAAPLCPCLVGERRKVVRAVDWYIVVVDDMADDPAAVTYNGVHGSWDSTLKMPSVPWFFAAIRLSGSHKCRSCLL